eukprot:750368-Rhodomonas_salina.1
MPPMSQTAECVACKARHASLRIGKQYLEHRCAALVLDHERETLQHAQVLPPSSKHIRRPVPQQTLSPEPRWLSAWLCVCARAHARARARVRARGVCVVCDSIVLVAACDV